MELTTTATATMRTNDEEAAAETTTDRASESSRLVLVHEASELNLNATNNRKKTWKMGVAAASLLLIFCGTFRYSHLRVVGSRSEMSAVHYVPDAGKGESCLRIWGTSCGEDLSCDDNHVCQDNAGPGQPCGPAANGIDCVAGYWCGDFYRNVYKGVCV